MMSFMDASIVIPVNRFSMFENRLIIDPDPRMETLDRRIPGKDAIQDVTPHSYFLISWFVEIDTRSPQEVLFLGEFFGHFFVNFCGHFW